MGRTWRGPPSERNKSTILGCTMLHKDIEWMLLEFSLSETRYLSCSSEEEVTSSEITTHYPTRQCLIRHINELLNKCGWKSLEHPPYSSYMSSCDFDLFSKGKERLGRTCFRDIRSIISAIVLSMGNSDSTKPLENYGRNPGGQCQKMVLSLDGCLSGV